MTQRKIDSWFLGIDLGTGSCKTVVVSESAQVLAQGSAGYPSDSVHEKWHEQEPQGVLSGMVASVQKALETAGDLPGNCAGVSIGGALHSVMAVDSTGAPLTGIMTWADGRAAQQSKDIRQTPLAEMLYQQTGCPVHGLYPLSKIRWLKEKQPQTFNQSARFLSAKEYVIHKLTGQYVIDYSVASGSGLLDTHSLAWNPIALDQAHIRPEQLSDVVDPRVAFAGLDPDLAQQMGIAPSTRLTLGSSDAANSSLGAGAVSQRQATCMIGTSGALRVIAPGPILDPHGRTWCYALDRQHWLVGGAINNGGIALSWLRDFLNSAIPALSLNQQITFDALLDLASAAPVDAGGLICLPFFTGERSPGWNQDSRAVLFGLSMEHEARHIARALLEGIAFRFVSLREALAEIGCDFQEIRASGGFSHSRFWLQLMTDALGCELQVPTWGETSCLGAAFWSLLGAGVLSDLDEISSKVTIQERFQPNPDDVSVYEKLYGFYRNLYQTVSPSFGELAALKATLALK